MILVPVTHNSLRPSQVLRVSAADPIVLEHTHYIVEAFHQMALLSRDKVACRLVENTVSNHTGQEFLCLGTGDHNAGWLVVRVSSTP